MEEKEGEVFNFQLNKFIRYLSREKVATVDEVARDIAQVFSFDRC